MADEIKNGQEDLAADISNTIPEKPKRKRTVKKADDVASASENIANSSPEIDDKAEQAKPKAPRKPRKKPENDAEATAEPSEKPKTTKKRNPKVDKTEDAVPPASNEDEIGVIEQIAAVDLIAEILNGNDNDILDNDKTKEIILEVPTVIEAEKTDEEGIEAPIEAPTDMVTETANEETREATEPDEAPADQTIESAIEKVVEKTSEEVCDKEEAAEEKKLPPLMNIDHFFDYRPMSSAEEEPEKDGAQDAEMGDGNVDADISTEDGGSGDGAETQAEEPVIQEYENYTILDEIERESQEKEVRERSRYSRDDAKYNADKPRAVDKRFDLIELFVFTLVIIMLLTTFVFKHSVVDGASMQNTLQHGDHLIVSDLFYKPKQYDIIVFQDVNLKCGDRNYRDPIVKRIIATEGQYVEVIDMKTVYVDGQLVPLEYATVDGEESEYREEMYPFSTTVPEGEVFVMGDHRNASDDSRYFGTIKEEAILGKVLFRIYPLSEFGAIKP